MAVNINDFARYARSTRMIFVQIIIIPLSFMLMSFMGIIIAGAASDLYGEDIWDPLTIMSHWTGSSQSRAGAAFVGLSFVFAQLGTNISANCISAANDLNAMFPKVSKKLVFFQPEANIISISTSAAGHTSLRSSVRGR